MVNKKGMLTFAEYVVEAISAPDVWSWSYHPVHGIVVMDGYHRHYDIKEEHPEVYENPRDPSYNWNPPAGFAKVDRRRRIVEFWDYTEKPGIMNSDIVQEFLKSVDATGFKVISPSAKTFDQRRRADWI